MTLCLHDFFSSVLIVRCALQLHYGKCSIGVRFIGVDMALESKLLDLGLDVSGLWRPGDQVRTPRFGDSGATRIGTGS